MDQIFHQKNYRRVEDISGLVPISTVFGVRYVAPHDWPGMGNFQTVFVAEANASGRYLNKCYVVGEHPQPRRLILARRRELLGNPPVAQRRGRAGACRKAPVRVA